MGHSKKGQLEMEEYGDNSMGLHEFNIEKKVEKLRRKLLSFYEQLIQTKNEKLHGVLAKINALTPFGISIPFPIALLTLIEQAFFLQMREKGQQEIKATTMCR